MAILSLISSYAFATSSIESLTYQGRILKSDGAPLEYSNVAFEFDIVSPSGLCILYSETVSGIDMRNSAGVFDVPIGSGTRTFPTSGTFTVMDAFKNSTTLNCQGGATYTPTAIDSRILRVQFWDGSGWKLISPDSQIRSVPYAGYSLSSAMLGSHASDEFLLKAEVNSGTTCSSGSFLTWDSTTQTFGCAAAGAGSGTVSSVTASSPLAVTNGTSTPNITIQAASGSQNGYLSSSDWTAFNNKLDASTTFAGDVSGTASTISVDKLKSTALSISSLSSNQVLKYSGGSWINSTLVTSDISGLSTTLSGLVAQSQFPASCAANQTLTFVSPSGSFTCSSIAINGSQVSGNIAGNAAGFTGLLAGDVSGTQGATSVDKIKGVAVSSTTPTNNQVLTYAGGSWAPADLPSGILSGSGTAGYVPYYNAATTLANSSLYYDGSNVGIGTTTPLSPLHIYDARTGSNSTNAFFQGNATDSRIRIENLTGVATSNSAGIDLAAMTTTQARTAGLIRASFSDTTDATRTSRLFLGTYTGGTQVNTVVLSGNNVGIGTSTPDALLNVVGLSPLAHFRDSGTGADILIKSSSSGVGQILADSGDQLAFGSNGTESVRISSAGNVGIGTTTPTQTLDVVGNIKGTQLCIGTDCRSAWPGTGGGGTVTSVASGTGLTGGPITGSGTLAVDVGTTANKIVQLDSSAKLPAVDGSALTNLNASNLASGTLASGRMPALTGDVTSTAGSTATTLAQIQGKSLTITSPASGDYLKYDGTGWINDALSSADLSDSSSLIKSSQMPANCAAGQTLTFSSPTGAWTCSSIVVTASNFSSQTQNTFLAAPNGSNGTPTFRTIASADLPSGTLSGSGTAGYVPYYSGTSTLANSNVYYSGSNIGIGTTTPSLPLDVNGDFRLGRSYSQADVLQPSTSIISVSGDDLVLEPRKDTTGRVRIKDVNSSANISFYDVGSGQIQSYGTSGTVATLALNPEGGNLGIGTTTPGRFLELSSTDPILRLNDVDGTGASAQTYVEFGGSSGGWGRTGWVGDGNALEQAISLFGGTGTDLRLGANESEVVRILASNGNVGIGTTSPMANTEIFGVGQTTAALADSGATGGTLALNTNGAAAGNGGAILFGNAQSKTAGSIGMAAIKGLLQDGSNNSTGDIAFATRNITTDTALTERMRIKYNGNVGIGTTSPTQKLEISGNVSITGGTNPYLLFKDSTPTSHFIQIVSGKLSIGNNGSMTIDTTGKIGIGTTSPTALLHVNGAALATAWNTSSDIRLKTNIEEIQNPLEKILQLRGVEFDWRTDIEQPTRHEETHDIGVIAQEVEKVFPEAVTTAKDGYKSVAYSKLISPVIAAVKSLYARLVRVEGRQDDQARQIASVQDFKKDIQALKDENSEKDKKIEQLEGRLERMEKLIKQNSGQTR